MHILSRRTFLGASALTLTAGRLLADPLGMPIGCQTYPVREALGKDIPGTLKQLAAIGYKNIEMCSPPGYERAGYAPFLKFKASELRQVIKDAGLTCESCHYNFNELKGDVIGERIAFAKELGLKQMILASFGLRRDATLSDWSKAADDLNKAGEQIAKAGLQAGFHNHDGEFEKIDGVLIYDHLMSKLDPKLVKMQFQVSVISKGYEAATYFNKYPGRFQSIHLQDWSDTEKKQVAVGKGVVDWKKLFAAAKKAGVKNYFVELAMDMLEPSYQYLHQLKA
jgi:sugar phosphate isomerase/epimerase